MNVHEQLRFFNRNVKNKVLILIFSKLKRYCDKEYAKSPHQLRMSGVFKEQFCGKFDVILIL